MILSNEQILERLKQPDERLIQAKKDHEMLLMQVHGIGIENFIKKIEGLENEEKLSLRKRLAISNKSMWSEILRSTDKIFKASGGSRDYPLKDKKKKETFVKILSDVTEGLSLRKWFENIWLDKYIVDPNGIILVENDGTDSYPTYKSILTIKDYKADGQDIEYIIFEPQKVEGEKYQLLRVYDDQADKMFKLENEKLTEIPEETYPNKWQKVPGCVNSDIINPITLLKQSPISEQMELAGEYFRENTVFTLYKYHHGFPLFWMYESVCPVCKGEQYIRRDNKETVCYACNGSGKSVKKDVSDVKYIKAPDDPETPIIAPNIAGYIVPPRESSELMSENLKLLKEEIAKSHWGTVIEFAGIEHTATEVTLNAQPIQDRLNKYSDAEEIVEQKITDFIGFWYYEGDYNGTSSINNGRNYIIKSPDQLLKEYSDDNNNGLNETVLNDKLIRYYEALYRDDATNLIINLKLIQVEPMIHYSVDEVLKMSVNQEIKNKKVYYNDWLTTVSKNDLFNMPVLKLQNSLTEYINQLNLQQNESQSQSSSSSDQSQREEV